MASPLRVPRFLVIAWQDQAVKFVPCQTAVSLWAAKENVIVFSDSSFDIGVGAPLMNRTWIGLLVTGALGLAGAVVGKSMGFNYSLISFSPTITFQSAAPAAQGHQVSAGSAMTGTAATTQSSSPSFDCETDRDWSERQICADETLSNYDRQLSALYRRARSGLTGDQRAQLKQDELTWLQERANCEAAPDGRACLVGLYQRRIRELGGTPD